MLEIILGEDYESAYQRGFQRGFQRGYKQGFERGVREGRAIMIRKLIAFKTIEEIAEFLEISVEEVENLLENHPA